MQMVATAWLVLQLTGSGVALGVETALAFGPMIVLGPWAGTLADHRDKRRILIGTQVAFGALALVLWALVATGSATLSWSTCSPCSKASSRRSTCRPGRASTPRWSARRTSRTRSA